MRRRAPCAHEARSTRGLAPSPTRSLSPRSSSTERSGPGQIRDAAAGRGRWPLGPGRLAVVRLLATGLLSGPDEAVARGPVRPGPEEARSPGGPQGHRRRFGSRERMAGTESLRPSGLVRLVRERFGLMVHPRSFERALARAEKKGDDGRAHRPAAEPEGRACSVAMKPYAALPWARRETLRGAERCWCTEAWSPGSKLGEPAGRLR